MQDAFATVIWIVCGLGVVIGIVSLAMTSKTWEDYGKGGLVMDGDRPREPRSGRAAATGERDAEIRQLVVARNHRGVRTGEPPLDGEAEIEREIVGLQGL